MTKERLLKELELVGFADPPAMLDWLVNDVAILTRRAEGEVRAAVLDDGAAVVAALDALIPWVLDRCPGLKAALES